MKVVITVCTYKRPLMLQACLCSLYALEIPQGWEVEVLIVDNEPDSSLGELLSPMLNNAKLATRYIIEHARGIPQARNAACREAMAMGAQWIAMIDDDEEASPGWLAAYVEAIQKGESEVFTGPVNYLFPPGYAEWLENKGKSLLRDGTLVRRASTNNVIFSQRLLREPWSLSFDENMALSGGSDSDFFIRYIAKGGKIYVVTNAFVTEVVLPNRLTMRWRLSRQYRSSINRVYISFKISSPRAVVWSCLKLAPKRLVYFLLGLITSPLFLFLGYKKFKRAYYHAFRHLAKALGTIAGLLGKHPEPYRVTDGN